MWNFVPSWKEKGSLISGQGSLVLHLSDPKTQYRVCASHSLLSLVQWYSDLALAVELDPLNISLWVAGFAGRGHWRALPGHHRREGASLIPLCPHQTSVLSATGCRLLSMQTRSPRRSEAAFVEARGLREPLTFFLIPPFSLPGSSCSFLHLLLLDLLLESSFTALVVNLVKYLLRRQ